MRPDQANSSFVLQEIFEGNMNAIFDRRRFLQFSLAGGALLIADAPLRYARASESSGDFLGDIGPYLKINEDNTLILGAPSPEIGSGMHTSLPMLIAEELGADFETVSVKQMPIKLLTQPEGGFRWAYGVQGGGGSFTLRRNMDPVRRLAAVTKNVLIASAAEELNVQPEELHTESNHVVHQQSGRRVAFSTLAARASAKPFPEIAEDDDIALKDPSDYSIIGKWQRSKGVEGVVTGDVKFGIDGELPGMLHAVMTRCPYFKGSIASLDDAAARGVPGVRHIVTLDPPAGDLGNQYISAGVAVVADSLWAALKARRLLEIEWNKGDGAGESSASLYEEMAQTQSEPGVEFAKDGEGRAALEGAQKVVEATYELPLLAHATMEPMNCIVHARADSADVVAPGHSCGGMVVNLSRALGIEVPSINMISMRTGGSFGRRLRADMAVEAGLVSRQVNAPVKLVWTREDDMGSDYYRPQSRHIVRAALTEGGKISAWSHSACLATSSAADVELANVMRNTVWADNYPRRLIDNFEIDAHHISWATPNGPWRAPMPTQHAFIVESFINELAAEAGIDPLEFRLRLLGEARDMPYDDHGGPTYNTGRWAVVLQKAAEEAGWGGRLGRRQGRGIAGYFTFGSYCAVVVDVEASRSNDIRVTRIVVAGDAGLIVNPNGFKSQLEGGVLDGLSTALRLKVDVEDGRAVQQNFDSYQFMRMADAPPVVETYLIQGANEVHGTGEIATPPLAPALCDAIYQATGKRIRKLPIGDQLKA
ncbi:molybdopterin-dependent oxidoreductase [Hyphococcus flavus]|uniref:Molybdopterin-dependent oxidoreductase n=1 Tax=Hyphococcus flavus TaxID=1866326 RepID=A0AAE9ZA78_9PROT|nr:molybdopterin cofactor-binding domain-containing protein [Hyphococcus flavus]WDI30459.1 molybdopterin-dependent oxidoreductase [Hyphococcus flavus]